MAAAKRGRLLRLSAETSGSLGKSNSRVTVVVGSNGSSDSAEELPGEVLLLDSGPRLLGVLPSQ
jgi:hypothetical protein